MRKIKTLFRAPVLTQSGYGVHARQILSALLNEPLLDLFVEACPWGACSNVTHNDSLVETAKQLARRYEFAKHKGEDKEWDVFLTLTIPNEFERRGRINIGITAGTETTKVSPTWLQKCNEMDLIVVPSEHARKALTSTVAHWQHKETGERGELKLERPITVCPEGFDPNVFHPHKPQTGIGSLQFDADFNFLVVGQWAPGGYGEDRKNIANTILYFLRAFQNRHDVGLVLKLNMGKNSEVDYEMVSERIRQIKSNFPAGSTPPVHLVHGNLTDEEMSDLYCHPQIKAFLSLTHGEGFGLPLLEAAACEVPIVATAWSGHLDFLEAPERLFSGVSYELKQIPPAAVWEPILIKDSEWAVAKEDDAIRRMRKIVDSHTRPKQWAQKLARHVHDKFTLKATQATFLKTIKGYLSSNAAAQAGSVDGVQNLIDDQEAFNVLYTMPMSTGDVFLSTAIIDSLYKELSEKHETVHIYFATLPQYFDILQGNKQIHKIIPWQEYMMNIDMLEQAFDLVLTPNIATQFTFSNWVRGGNGRLLVEEFANHCQVDVGNYHIEEDDSIFSHVLTDSNGDIDLRKTPYVTFHPGSGKGQWEARNYHDWNEVLVNIKQAYPDVKILQVGSANEPVGEPIDVDLRGKTTVQQLASVIKASKAHICIDTFTMHLAAAFDVPVVALFGSSHAKSTGPKYKDNKNAKYALLEAQQKMGCKKACYKYQCHVNPGMPCINEIQASEVVQCVESVLKAQEIEPKKHDYQRVFPKISGYTTSYNAITMGYPFIESIRSMLGFCEEVVVVDHSTDGTYELLEKMAADEPKIQLYQREWDMDNPTMDGDAKAFARALCQYEFCWQQDLDEVVHEEDYEKIQWIAKRFPTNTDILHLPVVECWGDAEHVTGRRHAWKWRLSRNKPNITHAVNKYARLTDAETGQIYAKEGMSDGCEYVDLVTYEPLPHTGFYTKSIEDLRVSDPKQFAHVINLAFQQLPSVFHYSWINIPKKIEQFKLNWDRQWSALYKIQLPPRFPEKANVSELVARLQQQGGEDNDPIKYKFKLERTHPAVMDDWLAENTSKPARTPKQHAQSVSAQA